VVVHVSTSLLFLAGYGGHLVAAAVAWRRQRAHATAAAAAAGGTVR
jgi:hypothetical protein